VKGDHDHDYDYDVMKIRLTRTLLKHELFHSFTAVATTATTATCTITVSYIPNSPYKDFLNAVCARWYSNSNSAGGTHRPMISTIIPPTTESCNVNSKPKKIAIAMSGGVDSSVVAYLLTKSHPSEELMGIHMSNWDYADENPTVTTTMKSNKNNSYCWEQDWKDTNAVATQLNIPIHHVSFQAEYWNEVFQPYCQQLSQSITPNPDVDCNRYIKFGALKDFLEKRFSGDVDCLATGHYARIWDRSRSTRPSSRGGIHPTINDMPPYLEQALQEEESTVLADYILHSSVAYTPLLFSARDRSKDQSYFLSGVPSKAFSGVLFPLGDLFKTEHGRDNSTNNSDECNTGSDNRSDSMISVRQLAQHAQLPNANKRDSVGICFIGKRKHGDFINEYVDTPLDKSSLVQCINVENNEVVATFDPVETPSLAYATIGQGAKISGATQKWFIVNKQLKPPRHRYYDEGQRKWESPCVFICPGTHHPSLYADIFYIRSKHFNWMAGGGETNRPPPLPFRAKCRIRHLQPLVECEIAMVNRDYNHGQTAFKSGEFDNDTYAIRLKQPLRGIAPGQVCVIYAGGKEGDLICIGGGPIDESGPNYWEMKQDLPKMLHPSGQNDFPSFKQGEP